MVLAHKERRHLEDRPHVRKPTLSGDGERPAAEGAGGAPDATLRLLGSIT